MVTTVPSSEIARDDAHPLRRMVDGIVGPTRDRYRRLLVRSAVQADKRDVVPEKFTATTAVDGATVLLIDDTWVSGGSVQSAAGALKAAGAGEVGVVVFARLIDQDYGDQGDRLKKLPKEFGWATCAIHRTG